MKMLLPWPIRFCAFALLLALQAISTIHAATYYWDTNDSTAGFGTAGGTWAAPTTNNSTQGWSTSSAGTNAMSGTTTTGTGDALYFGDSTNGLATGTVTVSGSVSAGSITFGSASGNITLGGTNQTITLGSTPTITVDSTYATIVAKIAGTPGLTKNGTGTLVVPLPSTYSGPTTVNGGTLRLENLTTNGGADLKSTPGSTFNINNGSTLVIHSNAGGNNRVVSNGDTFNFDSNGGGTLEWSKGNILMQGGNWHGFVTNGGLQNVMSGTNGGYLNGQFVGVLSFNVADGSDDVDLLASVTISNALISKNGTGTLSIRSMSNHNITVDQGTLDLGGAAQLNSGSYSATLTTNGTFSYSSSATQTISSAVVGTGGVTVNGTGTLQLTGANTYTGSTAVTAGTLQLGSGGTTGTLSTSSALSTGSGGVFSINRSNTVTQGTDFSASAITGTGGILQAGSGTTVLNAANTYSGSTTINAGTLQIDGNIANSGLVINSGGIITPGTSAAVDSFGTSSITINGGGYNWTMTSANGTAGTNWDQITSTGALTSNGQLTVYAYGTPGDWNGANSYDWDIISANSAAGFSASNFALDLSNFGIAVGNRTGTWSFSNPSGGIIRLSYTASGDPVWAGGTGNFSTGFSPSASNGDDVAFSGAGGTATNDSLTSVNDLTFRSGAGAYTIAGTALTVNGSIINNSVTTQTFSAAPTGDVTVNANSGNITISGVHSGSGNLTKTGSNTLTLSATNTNTGTITVSEGTLEITNLDALGSNATGTVISSGGALHKNVGGTFYEPLTITGNGSGSGAFYTTQSSNNLYGQITLAGNATIGGTQRYDMFGGGITDGAGSYTLTYEGSSNFYQWGGGASYDKLVINNGNWGTNSGTQLPGTIEVNSGGTISSWGYSGANGGTITFNSGTFNPASGSNSTQTWDQNMVLNGSVLASLTRSDAILSGVISGSGNLTTQRNIANTYASVIFTNASNTWDGKLTIGSGSSVEVRGSGLIGGGSFSSDIVNSGTFTYNSTATQTISGSFSGSGSIIKNGTGTLTITGATSTGAITINSGSLVLQAPTNYAGLNASGININNGSTVTIQGTYGMWASKTFTFDSNGGGAMIIGYGNNVFRPAQTFTTNGGSQNTISGGALNCDNAVTHTFNIADGTDDIDLLVSAAIQNLASIQKTGAGKMSLSSASNTYSGSTTITAGTLEVSGSGKLGSGSYAGDISNSGTFSYNSTSAQTLSGVISGAGALIKDASSTLTLSGSNTYSGGTTLNAGTLVIGNAAAAGTGTITQADGTSLLKFDTTGTVANDLSIYNVATNQTITLSGNITAQNTTYDVASGTTLSLNGTISGSGGITKNGTGTLEVNGASNTYTGDTVVNAGTLEANASGALGASGNITVHNGGSLLVQASNAIGNSSNVNLNGGTWGFNGDISDTVGALTLSANSTIDMSGGNISLIFSGLASALTSSTRLNVYNYTLYSDHIYFTSNANLSSSLPYISFYSGFGTGFIGSSFIEGLSSPWQVRPVPEPETWATAALLLIGGGIWMWRKRRPGECL